jgi:hypothetical protein
MNRVERQDRVRQHVCLDAQVLSPYFPVRGESSSGRNRKQRNRVARPMPLKRDLSGRDARLILQGDPLITTMLNDEETRCVEMVPDMMIGRHRRPQLVG